MQPGQWKATQFCNFDCGSRWYLGALISALSQSRKIEGLPVAALSFYVDIGLFPYRYGSLILQICGSFRADMGFFSCRGRSLFIYISIHIHIHTYLFTHIYSYTYSSIHIHIHNRYVYEQRPTPYISIHIHIHIHMDLYCRALIVAWATQLPLFFRFWTVSCHKSKKMK